MQKLIFRNGNGKEINLTSGDYGITEWEGFSANELNIQSQQVPFQDGGVFLDALLEQRILSVTVAMNAKNDLEKRYRLRREMISTLNPKLGEGLLIYTNDFLSKQIHVIPQLPVFENNNSNDSGTPKVSCSFVACNPYWEDIEETEVVIDSNSLVPINYDGDVPSNTNLKIMTQTAGDYKITNKKNDDSIGLELSSGQQDIIVTTNTGNKNIQGRSLQNKINFNKLQNIGSYIHKMYYSKEKKALLLLPNENSFVLYSKDGFSYDIISLGVEAQINDVVYCESIDKFVGVGTEGKIFYSGDAKGWDNFTFDATYNITQIFYSKMTQVMIALAETYNGSYVDAHILASDNGTDWTEVFSASDEYTQYNLRGIVESTSIICVSGYKDYLGNRSCYILNSTDGVNWNIVNTSSITQNEDIGNIIYYPKNNRLDIIAINSESPSVLESSNGNDWTRIPISQNLNELIYVNDKDILFGKAGLNLYQSQNFITWTKVSENIQNIVLLNDLQYYIVTGEIDDYLTIEQMYFNYEKTVILNNINLSNSVKYISTIKTFISVNSQSAILIGERWQYINGLGVSRNIANNTETGQIIIASGNNGIFESYDGVNWQLIKSTTQIWNDICYSERFHKYYALSGYIAMSADGVNWENTVTSTDLYSFVSPLKNLAVVVGRNGYIATSNDGTTFTQQTSNTNNTLRAVAYSYNDNLYIAVGDSGTIVKSYDGINWLVVNQITIEDLLDITYAKDLNLFIGVGRNGTIIQSSDGENWTVRISNVLLDLYTVAYSENDNLFIITTTDGYLMLCSEITTNYENYITKTTTGLTLNLESGVNNILIEDTTNAKTTITYRQKYLGV